MTIKDSLKWNFYRMQDSLTSSSEAVTSMTMTAGSIWPFVTIPHFEIRGQRARSETFSETFGFTVLVDLENKAEWEAYSVQNQGWVFEGRGIDVESAENRQFLPNTPVIPRQITYMVDNSTDLKPYGSEIDAATLGSETPFLVNWQMSPAPALTYTVNLNLRTTPMFGHLVEKMLETQGPVVSDFTNLTKLYETIHPPAEHQNLHEEFLGTREGRHFPAKIRPHSIMMSPIFDSFDNATRNLVGAHYAVLPWDWQFSDLLPEQTELVHLVLDNNCGYTFTYKIRGATAILMGINEEVHETQFRNKMVSLNLISQPIVTSGAAGNATGGTCEYTVRIYPTREMKKRYESSRPEHFSIIIAAIFLFVGVVFLIFVRFVQDRQEMVMATAIRTSAIVSSLFPANVRERIMKDAENQGRLDAGKNRGLLRLRAGEISDPKSKLEMFLGEGEKETDGGFAEDGHDAFASKPIADLFPEGRWFMLVFEFEICPICRKTI